MHEPIPREFLESDMAGLLASQILGSNKIWVFFVSFVRLSSPSNGQGFGFAMTMLFRMIKFLNIYTRVGREMPGASDFSDGHFI